jgi:hypothetical protein
MQLRAASGQIAFGSLEKKSQIVRRDFFSRGPRDVRDDRMVDRHADGRG